MKYFARNYKDGIYYTFMYIIVSVDVWTSEVSSLFELEATDKYAKQKFKPNGDDKGWCSPRWMEWTGG